MYASAPMHAVPREDRKGLRFPGTGVSPISTLFFKFRTFFMNSINIVSMLPTLTYVKIIPIFAAM